LYKSNAKHIEIMTANQITKQLVKLGFSLEGLTIGKDKIQVYVHTKGFVENKNERILNKILKATKWSGYASNTQYGAWNFYINQKSNEFVRNNID
jgi:hypothetical protein